VSIDLASSWRRAWRGIGAGSDGEAVGAALTAAYGEPNRRYHTLQHLGECLALFERFAGLAVHPAEVETGLWFHDAVYDVQRSDNEERSADWMREAALADGVAADVAERVGVLVLATCHAALPSGADEQLLVDIDLAVLGADDARFAEYERQIRAEYAFVPMPIFAARRRSILAAFLDRRRIYSTPQLHDELEQRARANLARSIAGDDA
jgi:predicted metal-dependent HD superfamily phosphohydrolase